jgi:serine protease Do
MAVLIAPVLVLAGFLITPATLHAQDVRALFKRVNPSVVTIRSQEREITAQGQPRFTEVGSGVLISADGQIMTAAHVVQLADEVTVEIGGEQLRARVIASEPDADVSLIKLDRVPPKALVAPLGNSDLVETGDQVIIVGAPYGIGHSLSVGHISGRHAPNTVYGPLAKAEFLQTDAAINTGNSGGPMFNMSGEVIGIVSHIISKSGGFEGLGFVVTANKARKILIERHAFWSGLKTYFVSGDVARVLNLPQPTGLLVQQVARNSPAERLGLRGGTIPASLNGQSLTMGGDVLLSCMDIKVEAADSLDRIRDRMSQLRPGDSMRATVMRDGRTVELNAPLP